MKKPLCAILLVLFASVCPADGSRAWITGPARASMKFATTAQGKPYVSVVIKERNLYFLVDTGGTTLIDLQTARDLGLNPVSAGDEATTLVGSGGERFIVHADLGIGKFSIGNYQISCIDLAYFKGLEQPELAGIIGTDLLSLFRAQIDYGKNLLTFKRPK